MRITFPASQVRVVRRDAYMGVTLYQRKLNQNPLHFISYEGIAVHVGSRKHCLRMFRRYVPSAAVFKASTAAN